MLYTYKLTLSSQEPRWRVLLWTWKAGCDSESLSDLPPASESRNLNTGRLIPKPIDRTNYSIPRLSTLSGISRLHLSCLWPSRLPELPVQSSCTFSPAPHSEISPVVITSPQLISPGLHTCLLLWASLGVDFQKIYLIHIDDLPRVWPLVTSFLFSLACWPPGGESLLISMQPWAQQALRPESPATLWSSRSFPLYPSYVEQLSEFMPRQICKAWVMLSL